MNIQQLEQIELNRIDNLLPQKLIKDEQEEKEKIHIVYVMVWTKVCGGSKIILEYANRLARLGEKITIITYDNRPDWFELEKGVEFIQVPSNKSIADNIPECDLIVATSWKCIYESIKANKAPVAFFEQGGAHLFEQDNLSEQKKKVVRQRFEIVPFIYTVSKYSQDIIKKEFNRESEIMYNAIDNKIFYPRSVQDTNSDDVIEITIIGSEDFKFKNIDEILQAIRKLKQKYDNIKLNWITQTKPEKNNEPAVINPPQKLIGEILRKTDIYICNSEYESFGLPILEAMTCGAAVITTDTGGMRDFVVENENAILIQKHNIEDIYQKTEFLINNKEFRKKLSEEGMKTAQKYNWDNSIKHIDEYYRKLVKYKISN